MDNLISQFAHIFIHYYSNKASSTCKLFISEPTKSQEDKMGRLFGIFEINTPSRENSLILTQIINELEQAYYSQHDEGEIKLENAFENALAQINQKFIQLVKEKKFYLVGNLNEFTIKEKINFGIGVLKNTEVYLSYLNNIGLHLIHKTKQDYKIIDIKKLAIEEKNSKDSAETKLFSNMIAGEIKPEDFLLIANQSFLEFISLERVQKTFTSLPINKAAEYFKNSLLQHENHNFAAIMIKNSLPEQGLSKTPNSLTSIDELNLTESSTERLLEPSFLANLKNLPKQIYKSLISADKLKGAEQKSTNPETKNSPNIVRAKNFGQAIKLPIKKLFKSLAQKAPHLQERGQNIKMLLRFKLASFGNKLKKIPNLSKILLIVAILFIILFVYSTSYFKNQQIKNANDKEFLEIAAKIEEQKNQADSDLIYGNEDKARLEIAEAQKLLATLQIESQKQKDRQEQLSKDIESIVAKLRKITTISEPILIADLGSQQVENINVSNLISQNNLLLAFDSLNNFTYKVNLETREVQKIIANLSDIVSFGKAKKIDDQILIYHNKNGFVQLANDRLQPITVAIANTAQIADFASYNGRLYTLDLSANQIYRMAKAENGYGSGLSWLKENLDLKNIVSLGIDSNIWLLDSTGPIIKLNKGKKQNFSPKNLEPALEAPSQLFTNDETNFLYILEPKNKRIVVLDKEGNLIIQYYSPSFDNLKSIEVIEKEKRLFLVNDNKIYFFNMTHL